jgi:hypothetical protein
MLILTFLIVTLTGFALAAAALKRPPAAVEIHPAAVSENVSAAALDTAQGIRPAAMRVFQTLTTLSVQMCQAAPQTSPVQIAGGRLGMHSLTIQPLAAICSLHAA